MDGCVERGVGAAVEVECGAVAALPHEALDSCGRERIMRLMCDSALLAQAKDLKAPGAAVGVAATVAEATASVRSPEWVGVGVTHTG